jgi:hypothetical protein
MVEVKKRRPFWTPISTHGNPWEARLKRSEMPERIASLSRSQLIGGVMATGALAACGGGVNTPVVSPGSATIAPSCVTASSFGVNDIFCAPVFKGLDKATLAALFDPSPKINANRHVRRSRLRAAKSRQIAGILVAGPAANPTLTNVTITNGTVANLSEYGILATSVCGLNVSRITVTGVCLQNLNVRFLTPAGIHVSGSGNVAISNCSVTQLEVTTDSCAGIMVLETIGVTVSGCRTRGLGNHDGAVQGFSCIKCINVTTTGCTADTLQSHFNGNVLTSGHTVLGFCPILCLNLSYVDCSASGLTGCCDDCHGMSVFLDDQVTVSRFRANQIVDGVSPSNSGAKATGLRALRPAT